MEPGTLLATIGNTGKIVSSQDAYVRGEEMGSHWHQGAIEVDPARNERMAALRDGKWDEWAKKYSDKEIKKYDSPVKQQAAFVRIIKEYCDAMACTYDEQDGSFTRDSDAKPDPTKISQFIANATAATLKEQSNSAAFMNPWEARVEPASPKKPAQEEQANQ
ncbi:MAG: hypothetical protein AABZ44_02210 [Elusimicrobiota bacterium]